MFKDVRNNMTILREKYKTSERSKWTFRDEQLNIRNIKMTPDKINGRVNTPEKKIRGIESLVIENFQN